MEKRQSNFEWLRILCMFLIVGFHITGQTNMDGYGTGDGIVYYYCILIGSAGRLVCNTFVMIGAWFLVDSKFRPERVINLWLEIFIYSVAITVICFGIGCEDASTITLIQAFFPIFGRPVWFGAEYICLLLLTPWLNEMLTEKNMHRTRQAVKLFAILIIGCATLFPIGHTTPAFSELIWFCFLYLFTGLYKRGQMPFCQKIERYSFLWFILSYLILCSMRILADTMGLEPLRYLYTYYRGHYESLLGFACSFFLFLTFKNWKAGYNRFVNLVSRASFAVYVIHQTPAFYRYMWNGIFQVDASVENGNIIGYSLLVIAVIFAVSVCVDNIRLLVLDKLICKCKAYHMVCKRLCEFYQ
ncbi:MAG: acyltransferase [Lachnospiraceae bacterium]|nr:acyltransferase [Lachnospiraceae bacterium]